MKGSLKLLLSVFILLVVIEIKPAPFDTGMATLTQPNNVTFTGRIWGDEYIWWAETEDGYRFIQSSDGWYYYATLDQNGEYVPTIYKVGIDTPPISSYQLERSQAKLDEIKQRIDEFGKAVERAGEWYAQKQTEAHEQPVTLKVGVILIEFQDVKHFRTTEPPNNRPNGYFTTDFDSMMFSYNYWSGSNKHPENELVFGSFRDYWDQISCDKLKIAGHVVNPTDGNGVPEWLTADYNRNVYYSLYYKTLANEAINKATVLGWISLTPGDTNYYDKLVVVFARNGIKTTNLFTYADPDSHYIQISERCSEELWSNDDYTFTHTGVYAHEFGHNLGFNDEYSRSHSSESIDSLEDGNTDTYNFDLMSWGIYNGPLRKGECPATLSPYYRIRKNWISSTLIDTNFTNFLAEYNYANPKVYRINPISAIEDEHFLFESRGREGFDKYIPWSSNDTINQPGRLIVWYHNMKWVESPSDSSTDRSRIINADNTRQWFSQSTDFFPNNFVPGTQDYNDITVPATTIGYRISSPGGGFRGNYRLAHFALNGIQKLANGNTLIGEIRLNNAMAKNQNSGGWQSLSVPVGYSNYSLSSIFPTAISAYRYLINNYVPVTTLENGPGYWVNFPAQTQTLIHSGTITDYHSVPVNYGWNITGTISDKVPVPNVCSEPAGIILNIYRYDGGYKSLSQSDSLKPGIGYWIKTSSAGNIILDRFAEPCGLLKINTVPEINLETMDKFIVTDADGNSQSLYVSNIDIDTAIVNLDIELPPLFPELPFDSRFEFSELVKKVSADSGTIDLNILVHANSFPLSLDWEINPANGINYSFISDSGLGKILNINSSKGKTAFNKLANNKIQLFVSADKMHSSANQPTEYSLEQNYPNPFNPSTKIQFSLKSEGLTTLKIYNVIGEEIKTLVNEYKDAGTYQVDFNAPTLPSGVYIYKLQAGDFVSSKKMILIK